jgi:hypothetical protein
LGLVDVNHGERAIQMAAMNWLWKLKQISTVCVAMPCGATTRLLLPNTYNPTAAAEASAGVLQPAPIRAPNVTTNNDEPPEDEDDRKIPAVTTTGTKQQEAKIGI